MSNKTNDIIDEARLENAQSISDTLVVFNDYGVRVKCSACKNWEEYGKESKQAILLNQNHDVAEKWVCGKCYKGSNGVELQSAGVQGYHIGQALNLAQAELLARGKDSATPDYWADLLRLRNEYLEKAVLK